MLLDEQLLSELKLELQGVITQQLAAVYTWKLEGQLLSLYNIFDELILECRLTNQYLTEINHELMKDVLLVVFAQLENEGYLTLEQINVPEQDIESESFFMLN